MLVTNTADFYLPTVSFTVYTSPTVLLFLLANYTLVSLVNSLDFYHISSEFILTTLSCSFVSRVQSFRCYTFSSLLVQRGKIFSSLLLKKTNEISECVKLSVILYTYSILSVRTDPKLLMYF